ncbi:MaoC/PaaZ C-terminal domain-containing protein [Kistimonas scapharcae]|uniref:MaoC/PaaZ C-terminal domain-containing protein n=1 Tax=Kistimonas scapharcae TaxID=1036133 RepID=A0ABP8VAB4_9GAMM
MQADTLSTIPSLWRLYAGAAVKRGRPTGDSLPALSVSVAGVRADRPQVQAYNRVCGFERQATLAPTFLHILSFPLQMHLLVHNAMPLAPVGLVHVRNRIRQYRPVEQEELLWIDCTVGETRRVEAGLEFDFITRIEANGEPVWDSVSTTLSRMSGKTAGKKPRRQEETLPEPDENWSLPPDLGRRYGAVSGDRNPIHLYPFTAKLFGFRRPIAHGMWSKARCLAALASTIGNKPFSVDVRFKTPVYLPSEVSFSRQSSESGVDFQLYSTGGRPHLTGEVAWL